MVMILVPIIRVKRVKPNDYSKSNEWCKILQALNSKHIVFSSKSFLSKWINNKIGLKTDPSYNIFYVFNNLFLLPFFLFLQKNYLLANMERLIYQTRNNKWCQSLNIFIFKCIEFAIIIVTASVLQWFVLFI